MTTRVGITKTAHHLPPGRMSAEEMARRTGLTVEKIHEDYGLLEKPVGGPNESALDHALKAGQALLEGIDPKSVDLLIYASGSMEDHPLWWGVYKLHEKLGLEHARFLEVRMGCIGSLHALEAAKNYMVANPKINRAIVIGAEGYHWSEAFADYSNPDNEPMFIFADGAAAALLETDRHAPLSNALGEFVYMVDSSHHEDVWIRAGGVKMPTTAETVAGGQHALQVPAKDPKDLRRFGIRYIANYLEVIKKSMAESGHEGSPDFVVSNQLKLPLMRILLTKLGLTMEHTAYTMPKWGHVGAADIILSLGEAMNAGSLKPGQKAAIVSSGVSFSWGATTLEML
jgi:3-oxoacyl-[acyl-carrier-protein] synthase-3